MNKSLLMKVVSFSFLFASPSFAMDSKEEAELRAAYVSIRNINVPYKPYQPSYAPEQDGLVLARINDADGILDEVDFLPLFPMGQEINILIDKEELPILSFFVNLKAGSMKLSRCVDIPKDKITHVELRYDEAQKDARKALTMDVSYTSL